ncbi:hypothetical protein DOTSEDRAFT_36801 [Dothistroma septosporum NZE10]|uniref:Uncharacterized protein n=1 Tax=Dothistroma septosporum (strain NZE10 / CBS 128990) TaxID=675120 RepID=N1PJ87_DOTSN|nr:hypothetical protein DOTSEDRAFT_36801 [Dothistroma septosporum NZE10]
MPPSGAFGRGLTDIAVLGTADQWYDARCIECRRRHRITVQVEEVEDQQEDHQGSEHYATRLISTASQRTYFCLSRCPPTKPSEGDRQDQCGPASRHRTTAQASTFVGPPIATDSRGDTAQSSAPELHVTAGNSTFSAYESHHSQPGGIRNSLNLKRSVQSLRSRVKQSISNMSLRLAVRDDIHEDAEPDQKPMLQSPASMLGLRAALKGQQIPIDADSTDAKVLRSASSKVRMRRAFHRREPGPTELPGEDPEETANPPRWRWMAISKDLPTRRMDLRIAISNVSLRSSSTMTARLDGGQSEGALSSLSQRRPVKAAESSLRSLTDSISSKASRAGFTGPKPQRDDMQQLPGRRLFSTGQLPPRGQVLVPPVPESLRNTPGTHQPIAKPEVMIHTWDIGDQDIAGDMYITPESHLQALGSDVRIDEGSMDMPSAALAIRRRDKYCDPGTLAILTGASHATSAENYPGFQLNTEDPFAQMLSGRRAGRYMNYEDDASTAQSSTSRLPFRSQMQSIRDDVSELHDSELFADFSSWSRKVSPITLAGDDRGENQQERFVERGSRHIEQKRDQDSSFSLAGRVTPRLCSWSNGGSPFCVEHRASGESSVLSWTQANANGS